MTWCWDVTRGCSCKYLRFQRGGGYGYGNRWYDCKVIKEYWWIIKENSFTWRTIHRGCYVSLTC